MMTQHNTYMHLEKTNPYAPPQSNVEVLEIDSADPELADRGTRLGANILDGLITGIPIFALMWGVLALLGYSLFSRTDKPPLLVSAPVGIVISCAVYLAINGYLLATRGQSVGKHICDIRITRQDGSHPTLWDSFVKRYVSIVVIGQIPFLGYLLTLIDPLFIFGEHRRCLHDRIAGTRVVKAPRVRQPATNASPVSAPPCEIPAEEPLPPPIPSNLEICPYCAELTSEDSIACRGCGRNPFGTDSATASRSLSVDELLRKATKLYALGLRQESLDTHVFGTLKFPLSKESWTGLLNAPNADQARKDEARQKLAKIERMLRGEPEL
jgi:uncharacterized RDD family membrane protein YckC